jgi:hypothetical protein
MYSIRYVAKWLCIQHFKKVHNLVVKKTKFGYPFDHEGVGLVVRTMLG